MTERVSVIRSAVLLSLALHGALGFWVMRGMEPERGTKQRPAETGQRLQVFLLTAKAPSDLPQATPRVDQATRRSTPLAERANKNNHQMSAYELAPPSTPGASVELSPATIQTAVAGNSPELQPKLDLAVGQAVQAAERQRRQSPLAGAIDAQQAQIAQSSVTRAFSRLNAATSSIVAETILADGGRVIRFSGGSCMRLPKSYSAI